MDQVIRKRIFGYAQGAWPELNASQRLDEIRALCAELNDGVFSLSHLPDGLAGLLLARIKTVIAQRRRQRRQEWSTILQLHRGDRQIARLAEIAIDIDWSPDRVLALVEKQVRKAPTSWQFGIDSSEMRVLLSILESYRRKQRNWYFERDRGTGQGPDRSRRRRRAKR